MRARVLEATRTASELKPGMEIAIACTNFEARNAQFITGPGTYIPVIEKGQKVPAFLSVNHKTGYSPAARIYSFESVR